MAVSPILIHFSIPRVGKWNEGNRRLSENSEQFGMKKRIFCNNCFRFETSSKSQLPRLGVADVALTKGIIDVTFYCLHLAWLDEVDSLTI